MKRNKSKERERKVEIVHMIRARDEDPMHLNHMATCNCFFNHFSQFQVSFYESLSFSFAIASISDKNFPSLSLPFSFSPITGPPIPQGSGVSPAYFPLQIKTALNLEIQLLRASIRCRVFLIWQLWMRERQGVRF